MEITFDENTCSATKTEENQTLYNVGCKIDFSCKDENKKREFILSEEGKSAYCMEDATWGSDYWPECLQGEIIVSKECFLSLYRNLGEIICPIKITPILLFHLITSRYVPMQTPNAPY